MGTLFIGELRIMIYDLRFMIYELFVTHKS